MRTLLRNRLTLGLGVLLLLSGAVNVAQALHYTDWLFGGTFVASVSANHPPIDPVVIPNGGGTYRCADGYVTVSVDSNTTQSGRDGSVIQYSQTQSNSLAYHQLSATASVTMGPGQTLLAVIKHRLGLAENGSEFDEVTAAYLTPGQAHRFTYSIPKRQDAYYYGFSACIYGGR